MNNQPTFGDDVLAYWNSRAGLQQWAGTRDINLKQLEIEEIAKHVTDGMRILEVGCGNGITAHELAKRFKVDIFAIDYAAEMIASAKKMSAQETLKGTVRFEVGDVKALLNMSEKFDMIYTERVLINLPDWPAQQQAIIDITNLLHPGGTYVMCESSEDGLQRINSMRERIGLSRITQPWHNHYFKNADIDQLTVPGVKLERVCDFSSTYYFLSRVINAWYAAKEGKEPDYDAAINQLAFSLPPIGDLGQTRIWLWRKQNPQQQVV